MSLPQPVPPSWKDLGKSSNDILQKEFPNNTRLEVKIKTPNNVTFKVTGDRDIKNYITGDLETKYTDIKKGLTLTQNWTTANILKSSLELDNYITNGLKLQVNTSLQPDKMTKGAVVSATYKQSGLNSQFSIDTMKGPTCSVDTVVGFNGVAVAAEASYNVGEGKITRYGFGTCYNAPTYSAAILALNNGNSYAANYYHRVSQDVEAAARALYDSKNPSAVNIEVGAKAHLDYAAYIKSKINSNGLASFSYYQTMRPGIKLGLGIGIDTQRLNDMAPGAAHTVGMNLTFDA